jgi:hypothetical protein
MITRKELMGPMLSRIEVELSPHGFLKNGTKQALYCKTPPGNETVHVALNNIGIGIEVDPNLAIRFDDLEDLIFENTTDFAIKNKRSTIGCYLKNIMPFEKAWLVSNPSDIDSIGDSIVLAIKEYGFPFFTRFSEQQVVLNVLVNDELMANTICAIPLSRALVTVGLAFLEKEQKIFEDSSQKLDRWLESMPLSGRVEVFREFSRKLKAKLAA